MVKQDDTTSMPSECGEAPDSGSMWQASHPHVLHTHIQVYHILIYAGGIITDMSVLEILLSSKTFDNIYIQSMKH